MRKQFLIANWKMNLPAEGVDVYLQELAELDASEIELVIAPPFPYLAHVHTMLASLGMRAAVGAQNCSDQEAGAFTGEVAAPMLREVGARYVIVGHSERRTHYSEDDQTVARKLRSAAGAGLVPILCVGEESEIRQKAGTEALLARQLEAVLERLPPRLSFLIAYEPIWAIGTGQNATPEVAAEAHSFIRGRLKGLGLGDGCSILYGGSVSPQNVAELAAQEQIDGFLVGGASLEAAKFQGIYEQMLRATLKPPKSGK